MNREEFPSSGRPRPKTARAMRPLLFMAGVLCLGALVSYGIGARVVVDRIVGYEGDQISRHWALALALAVEPDTEQVGPTGLMPYSRALPPERLQPLDTAIFDGEILGYRIYNAGGTIIASSQFLEVGSTVDVAGLASVVADGSVSTHLLQTMSGGALMTSSVAIAPLLDKGKAIGALEIRVDLTPRMAQLERLRNIVFLALLALLAALMGILGLSVGRLFAAQRENERELARREAQYRRLLDDAPDSIIVHDGRRIYYANGAAARMHGAEKPEDLLAIDPILLVPDRQRPLVDGYRAAVLTGHATRNSDKIGRRRLDGAHIEAETIGMPVEWDGMTCILVQSRDLTEERAAQIAVAASESRLTAFINHAPVMTLLLDRDFRVIRTNRAYDKFYGIDGGQVIGDLSRRWLPPGMRERDLEEARATVLEGRTFDATIEARNAKGECRLLHYVRFPIEDGKGHRIASGVILTDITEQAQREQELVRTRDEAQAANRAKSAFLANMSHEIRTPMNGVLGMTDLLSQSPLSADQHRYLDTIKRSGAVLLGIINNVLDVSRIEAGRFSLDTASFDLHALAADTVEILAKAAESKGILIAHHIAPDVPVRVIGDQIRLRQVLMNLLGNAVKFTSGGEVVLRLMRIGGDADTPFVRFEVNDTGIGIAREHQIHLFEAFNQADESIARKFGGTGLGLSIAQHIVVLMGGRIDVDSKLGEGSSFQFSVPLRADAASGKPSSRPPAGKRLLIVEANPTSREIAADIAAGFSMEVVSVAGAADAHRLLDEETAGHAMFDFALIDLSTASRSLAGSGRMPASTGCT